MRLLSIALSLCFAAGAAHAQDLQIIDPGTLDQIKGMTRVHVGARKIADREAIIKRIDGKHGLRVVRKQEEAEFFIVYQGAQQVQPGFVNPTYGQLAAYVKRGNLLIAVWLKDETDKASSNDAARSLAKKFIKDLGKIRQKRDD